MDHNAKWDLISSMVSSSLKGSPICSKHSSQHWFWQRHSFQGLCSPTCPIQEPDHGILPALPGALCELGLPCKSSNTHAMCRHRRPMLKM